ncbi:hypothetical protein [Burkholderia glumae]|uniref:hypothetical protein n=1 Tax=Burkholderia glumae TaxID=337 RepID=UPI0021503BCE|nr:hypothetical protein [Burkholderia glumae]
MQQPTTLSHGKLTLARVTPVIRTIFAPFGVREDGSLLADRNLFPMWLDLIEPMRALLDSLGIERPEDDHIALLVNLLTDHVGGIPRFTQGERLDGEVYDLREAFDLATALDDGHGLIDASRVGVVHTEGIPEVWTNTVTRRVDAHHVSTVMQSEAEALHDALRRNDHRQAARCIEETVQRALLGIRDMQARRKVAALIEIPA